MASSIDIGGYFELEIPKANTLVSTTNTMVQNQSSSGLLKSGRIALKTITQLASIKELRIPYFGCQVIEDVLKASDISYSFYEIDDQLEIIDPTYTVDIHYLYINYFGLKRQYARNLSESLKDNVIIDNTHDFLGASDHFKLSWSFNSMRKFFGVPDGAQLSCPNQQPLDLNTFSRNSQVSFDHLVDRLEYGAQRGYHAFQKNELSLGGDIERSSVFSETILKSIAFDSIRDIRMRNYLYLHERLAETNEFNPHLLELTPGSTPFSYPYLPSTSLTHEYCWGKKLYASRLWPECINISPNPLERRLAGHVIHLPVDHRYNNEVMDQIVKIVTDYGE